MKIEGWERCMNLAKLSRRRMILTVLFLLLSQIPFGLQATVSQTNSAKDLVGLWEAKRRFGPDLRGALLVKQSNGGWQAEIGGRFAPVKLDGNSISFELADGKGSFQGKFAPGRVKIVGHWIQAPSITFGSYASPVTLTKDKQNVWRGEVSPLDDTLTFYLIIKTRPDGTAGAFLKNPERNLGRFIQFDHLEREGESVKLFAADSASEPGRVLAEGKYDAEGETLLIYFSNGGGSFDFKRVKSNEASDFYPRGYPTGTYTYAPPPQIDDGWQVGTLEKVGINRAAIEKFIRMIIDTPIESVSSSEIHGVLIARHGKLVLEEYFHGENRDKPHDTRSAAKSLSATLVGAAIKAGVPIEVSTPVYRVMNGGEFPPDLEPRKKAMTVEHLLTMSSGWDCDDNDPTSLGGENILQQQTEQPDWYKYALALKMVRQPGETSLYCGTTSNMLGGVLKRASGQSLPVLFQNLLAEPLQIKKYYMNLTPTGDAYMGGGVRFLPRDFMKLGQLHLNGGVWNGRRILTLEWSRRATSHLVTMEKNVTYDWETKRIVPGTRKYGYQWWVEDYPYKGRTLRAFFAGGNGGQIVMVIPELDLVIAFYGGNYSDRATFIPQWVYVPQFILQAIEN